LNLFILSCGSVVNGCVYSPGNRKNGRWTKLVGNVYWTNRKGCDIWQQTGILHL